MKVQNIYFKPLLKPSNTYNKPCFKCAYLGENVIDLLIQKGPKISPLLWAILSFQNNIMRPQKQPNWQKISQFGHHEVWFKFFCLKIVVLKTLGFAL
jgi:hypothetical protein